MNSLAMARRTAAWAVVLWSTMSSAHAAMPPDPAHNEFHFVVLGDSQFHDPATYNRMIDDLRNLAPAFVIQVGDMIEGYLDDTHAIAAQWRRFQAQIAPLAPTAFLPVPGNHDLYNADRRADERLEGLYRDIWGELYYSFDYRNARFIVLNSDASGEERRIGPAQWDWLQATLKASHAEHIFVFLHRPAATLENADELHELLRRFPVRYVFYGHHHHYHYSVRDGIAYVMTNAAADGGTTLDEAGNFDHLLQVSVRDSRVDLALIRADGLEDPDYVHPTDNYDLFALTRSLVPDTVPLEPRAQEQGRLQGGLQWRMTIPISNPTDRELTVYAQCGSDDERWLHEPRQIEPLELSGKASKELTVEWSQSAARRSESEPFCELRVPFQTVRGEWFLHLARVVGQPEQD